MVVWYPLPVPISSTRSRLSTLSAWVIRPTMNGWLMVWPQAIGSAESSNARSLKSSWVNSGRGVVSMAFSTAGSITPCERRARIRRASRVSGVSSSCFVAISNLRRGAAEDALELVHCRHVRQVDVQRRHRYPTLIERPQIRALVGLGALLTESHPIILAAPQVSAFFGMTDMGV